MPFASRRPVRTMPALGGALFLALGAVATAQAAPDVRPASRAAVSDLRRSLGASVSEDAATGLARSVRFPPGRRPQLAGGAAEAEAGEFLRRWGAAFGVGDPASQFGAASLRVDALGGTRRRAPQVHRGVEVFGASLDVHVGPDGRIRSAMGRLAAGLDLDTTPRVAAERARVIAIGEVFADPPSDAGGLASAAVVGPALAASPARLYVHDETLLRGRPGRASLAWLVEVTGPGVREFVFVDAHSGKIANRWSGVHDALFRRLFQGSDAPASEVWSEGAAFPGALDADQQRIITGSGDAYWFFRHAFGRDSYDGLGHEMRSVNDDPRISCPNANWNGATTNYCTGVTSDDVVAHEWGHAYTEYTHNLIYQWQSGALNEAYSDIWGEAVDLLNGAGADLPGAARSDGLCSRLMNAGAPAEVVVTAPAAIAGTYVAGTANFGPMLDPTGIAGVLALADDGTDTTSDACEPLANDLSGRIALVDRGSCYFVTKVRNAQAAGAIAVVVADNDPAIGAGAGMGLPTGDDDSDVLIPSARVTNAAGNLLRGELAAGVSLRLRRDPSDESLRWLMGEDSTAFGGAIRDLWNPNCAGDPGRVGDSRYYCGSSDGGGVHTNSGVPNHAFALLVDGGTYNGHAVPGIGLAKAAGIYWRAQEVYQRPVTDFAEHADALEAACTDLVGTAVPGVGTAPAPPAETGETFARADCDALAEAIAAAELRLDPALGCAFEPLLAKSPPGRCADAGSDPVPFWQEDFEGGLGAWTLAASGVYAGWPGLQWAADAAPPDRAGQAAFAIDPVGGACDQGAGDWSGAMTMTSAVIAVPDTGLAVPRIDFDHYVASERGYDGGLLEISVNGGAFFAVPAGAMLYNPYNLTLHPAGSGGAGNTSPLAGQPAWSGTDDGSNGGSWGGTQVDLGMVGVGPGDTFRLRFTFGIDGCTGYGGWWVDDVTGYTCSSVGAGLLSIVSAKLSPGTSGRASAALRATFPVGTSPSDAVDATTGWRIRVSDGSGLVDETRLLDAAECRSNPTGTRLRCKSADGKVTAVFARLKDPATWKVSLAMKGLGFSAPPQAPVAFEIARTGRAWTGAIANCTSTASSGRLGCRP